METLELARHCRDALVTLVLLVTVLGQPERAHAAVCSPADLGCPAVGSCTITGVHDIEEGCKVDFADREVVLKGTLRAETISGSFDIAAGALNLMGGKLLSRGNQDDAGGGIGVVVAGAFEMSGNASVDVSGEAGGGTIEVTAGTAAISGGSVEARGGSGESCGDAGSIEITASDGGLTIAAPLSATTQGYDCAGGTIVLEGTTVLLSRNVSISGGSPAKISITATTGDLNVASAATLAASGRGSDGEGTGANAGEIALDAAGDVGIDGALEATGSADDGSGGAIGIVAGGSIFVRRSIDVEGKGGASNGGQADLEAGARIEVRADVLANGGDDGLGGSIRLDAVGDVLVIAGTSLEADAGNGTIAITAGPAAQAVIDGELRVAGLAGGGGGTIEVSACSVTVGGKLHASATGGGPAGKNLLVGGSGVVRGTTRIEALPCPAGDCNEIRLRAANPSIDPGAVIVPPPLIVQDDTVTACCGNGFVDAGEECDDGARLHCDGCTPSCNIEPPNPCADDGNACTGTSCLPDVGCQPLDRAACEGDGDPCTDDVCAESLCTHTSPCDGSGQGDDPCRIGTCTPEGCAFEELPDGTDCALNGCISQCHQGACVNPCDDGDECTVDTCLGGFCEREDILCPARCEGQPDGTPCSDGLACTTGTCQGETCVASPVVCDACEGVACFEFFGCFVPVVCQDDGNPCTADLCDPDAGGCVSEPLTGTACPSDGNSCTQDVCGAGICTHPATGCDDANACTADSCEADGSCGHEPVACDDANVCTTDSCDPATGCTNETVVCDDGIACTIDSCNASAGCVAVPSDSACDDGDPCTADTCDLVGGCTHTDICPDVDHFKCYRAANTPRTPRFTPVSGVSLVDAFEALSLKVRKPALLCAPTSMNGEDPSAPDDEDHLLSYQTQISAGSARFTRRTNLAVVTELGSVVLDVTAREQLLVPSAVSLTGPPGQPMVPNPDHFACYKVRVSKGAARFSPISGVTLEDRFENRSVDIRKPVRLCIPADKNGDDPTAPGHPTGLLCYQIKASAGSPRFAKQTRVHVGNQLGDSSLDLPAIRELCVPSTTGAP